MSMTYLEYLTEKINIVGDSYERGLVVCREALHTQENKFVPFDGMQNARCSVPGVFSRFWVVYFEQDDEFG